MEKLQYRFTNLKYCHFDDSSIFLKIPQVKQALGGKVRLILSGAAPLATHIEAYLKVVTCSHVLQGYGM